MVVTLFPGRVAPFLSVVGAVVRVSGPMAGARVGVCSRFAVCRGVRLN